MSLSKNFILSKQWFSKYCLGYTSSKFLNELIKDEAMDWIEWSNTIIFVDPTTSMNEDDFCEMIKVNPRWCLDVTKSTYLSLYIIDGICYLQCTDDNFVINKWILRAVRNGWSSAAVYNTVGHVLPDDLVHHFAQGNAPQDGYSTSFCDFEDAFHKLIYKHNIPWELCSDLFYKIRNWFIKK